MTHDRSPEDKIRAGAREPRGFEVFAQADRVAALEARVEVLEAKLDAMEAVQIRQEYAEHQDRIERMEREG